MGFEHAGGDKFDSVFETDPIASRARRNRLRVNADRHNGFHYVFVSLGRVIPELAIFVVPWFFIALFNLVANTFPAWATRKGLFIVGAMTTYRWDELEIEPGEPDGVIIRILRPQDAREVRFSGRVFGAVWKEGADDGGSSETSVGRSDGPRQ